MLEDTVISSINEVFTVPVPRGRRTPMQQRPQYGLSFCLGEGRIIYHHEGKEYLSDKDHAVWLPMGASYLLECRESGHFPLINFSCTVPAFTDFRSISLPHADSFLRRYETLKELYLFHHRYAGAMSVLYDLLSSLAPLEGESRSYIVKLQVKGSLKAPIPARIVAPARLALDVEISGKVSSDTHFNSVQMLLSK